MSEISREEAIKELSENNCVDCASGSSLVPTPQCKCDCKQKNSIIKAISDMQKLEKIEQIIDDIADYEHEDFEFDIRQIEQILRGGE